MAKNRRAKRRYEPSVTPTHFIRINRIKARIETGLKWFVLRTARQKERELEHGLREAGIVAHRAVEVGLRRDRRRILETEKQPAAGYVFAGFAKAEDGRSALWGYHEAEMAKQPPMVFQTENGEVRVQPRAPDERPFTRVIGPFDGPELQRFLNELQGHPYAVLWFADAPVAVFPARSAGIVDKEHVALAEPKAA